MFHLPRCLSRLQLDLIGDSIMAAAGLNNTPEAVAAAEAHEDPAEAASFHAASMLTFAHAMLLEAQNHVLPHNGEVRPKPQRR